MGIKRIVAGVLAIVSSALAGPNLVTGGDLEAGNVPAGFVVTGGADYTSLGDARRDMVTHGFRLRADQAAGEVACTVTGLREKTAGPGRWFRFSVRGLPQANFAVDHDDLYLKVSFFGENGKTAYDHKARKIYDQIETARRDLAVNGNRGQRGAEVWQTYQLDFCLPFPQVDAVTLAVGFSGGKATNSRDAAFLIDEISLVAIPDPADVPNPAAPSAAALPQTNLKLLPLGGRWYYAADAGETSPPKTFDAKNVDRLFYKDAAYSAPFAGNAAAVLRVGQMDLNGSVLRQDKPVPDNVTIRFESGAMAVHTHNVPNHPTGRFPEQGFGNPSYVQEQDDTYYFPLVPRQNPGAKVIDAGNANRALHMGPIGLAVNGVVFFNPFDRGSEDATNMMDRCCGHPNQDGQYHYHKYPICVNTPWADEGRGHSPLIGFAFDGYPVYGPYERTDVMAKDETGDRKLNGFNGHTDAERGFHYHVTPGQFPYLIGGFWGVEDARNKRPPRRGNGQGGGPGGPGERRGPR